METVARNLNGDTHVGLFTPNQNRAVLIASLCCSCVSLVATLVTLRWFMLMKRLFRHHLVLMLIVSDVFKALWYFIFPIVIFTRGPVKDGSAWCQASGFLLALSLEASDLAILLIALHALLYIFRPPVSIGKGGLYKFRKWLPLVWLGPAILSASLGFVNHGRYVSAGTFCYLPKRPIWYRLALAYVPRYIILITIFGMYAAISIYVHVKFRSFREIVAPASDSNFATESTRSTSIAESIAPDEPVPVVQVHTPPPEPSPPLVSEPPPVVDKKSLNLRPTFGRGFSYRSFREPAPPPPVQAQEPWDAMNFITSKPLQDAGHTSFGVQTADFAWPARGSASSEDTRVDTRSHSLQMQGAIDDTEKARRPSDSPTARTDDTGARHRRRRSSAQDPLSRTRLAIRQQLRFLFFYPATYALMWAFPFAQNCTTYSDYYVEHPIFWLQIVSACALALQACVDCLVFSWREKPWRHVDSESKFALPFWRDQSVSFIKRVSFNGSALFGSRNSSRKGTIAVDEERQPPEPPAPRAPRSQNWWEEEGKKRKDSVWMGTDLLSKITSRQSNHERIDRIETIEEQPTPGIEEPVAPLGRD